MDIYLNDKTFKQLLRSLADSVKACYKEQGNGMPLLVAVGESGEEITKLMCKLSDYPPSYRTTSKPAPEQGFSDLKEAYIRRSREESRKSG